MTATTAAAAAPRRPARAARAPAASPRAGGRRTTIAVLAGAVALTLALRLPFEQVPLGPDEGGLSLIARQWASGHGSLYGAYWLDRPPLLVALFALAVHGGATGVRVLGAVGAAALVAVAAWVGATLGGPRAGRAAAVLTAVLASASALGSVFTPSELLAAVPAAASVGCLVRAARGGGRRWLAAAGALALTAPLVKQSFLDAGAAGAAFLVLRACRAPRRAPGDMLAYTAGAAVPLAVAGAIVAGAGMSPARLWYALFGFRVDALRVLASASQPLTGRLEGLARYAAGSGLVASLALVPAGLWRLRHDRLVAGTVGAWPAAGLVGVVAGGCYWPHYLLQLAVPAAVLAGVALARAPWRLAAAAVAAIAAVGIGATSVAAVRVHRHPPRRTEVALARYVRRHARPGDTLYVLYAKAEVGFYAGLPSPFPYWWSLMDRALPGAIPRLDRLLASGGRPTWIVRWQRPSTWGLDPSGRTAALLHRGYRRFATVGGRAVYHRRAHPLPPGAAA